ncbi:MAG: hypothetical protein KDD82_04025 [Planctomycetes bacterium]|nr:hypothetical protein [Planctomycetota bacterium]
MSGSEAKDEPLVLDAQQAMRDRGRIPEVAGALGWLVPGLGHVYGGFPKKGLVSMVLVLGMYLLGLGLSRGDAVALHGDLAHPIAFVAQVGAGLPTGLAYLRSRGKLPGFRDVPAEDVESEEYFQSEEFISRLPAVQTGLLFTMIAGLLNLLLAYDAFRGSPGAVARHLEEARLELRVQRLREELANLAPAEAASESPPEGAPAEEAAPSPAGAGEPPAPEEAP